MVTTSVAWRFSLEQPRTEPDGARGRLSQVVRGIVALFHPPSVTSRRTEWSRGCAGDLEGVECRRLMIILVRHSDALDRIWEASRCRSEPPVAEGPWSRHFRDDAPGWESVTGDELDRAGDTEGLAWLEARWRIVELVYKSFDTLLPHIRRSGEIRPPRLVQGWEWCSTGLHCLWAAWGDPNSEVMVDLRPALFDFGDGFEQENLETFEVFYSIEGVEKIARTFERAAAIRLRRPRWHEVVALCALVRGLTTADKPAKLLEALESEELAERRGAKVSVHTGSEQITVAMSTFRHIARRALDGQLDCLTTKLAADDD